MIPLRYSPSTQAPPPSFYELYDISSASPPIPTSWGSSDEPNSSHQASTGMSEQVNDIIGQYAQANRVLISPSLEDKLRAASYLPMDNPDEMPLSEWQAYGVQTFELRRLQEAYDRNKLPGDKENAVHSAGQAGYSWRP
ncbi:SubName: Full=Uncharacterized protein {ECO:0000313/EMBL:CCA69851.1} [Serendipita indica DSM 11827]|uniref:Uncharacterized protein n=1 Tax=Serendipita indica (strain DSM 11827) TaxID=1109443 RepID=G4TET5_SERID|nr:SubName: Full=Uncharacterized protein {ECO:0000313/EMBL:CCA69851.1} [Serendipita indica DSM 11827]CCA69851.1 hypothetical protein PIIN_03790 [Serendipita indica DSM 11827]